MRKNKNMKKEKRLQTWGYKLFKAILGPIFKFYYNPKIINKEYIPESGSILIVGNHKHLYDQCLSIISTKRPIHYMAKKEYFDGPYKWFFKITGCIPVNRQIKDKNASDLAIDVLNKEGAIGIFPEGTRNKTNEFLLPFKYGSVSMAKKTNATIIPVGITGKYKRKEKLIVRFGTPFKVDEMSIEDDNKKLYNEISNLMKENIKLIKK